jgi:signal transduction histidine kinase
MNAQEPSSPCFDRELTLADLLSERDRAELEALVRALLGESARVHAGEGDGASGATCVPVTIELEPVATLCAAVDPARVGAAAALVQKWLRAQARYHMASTLHLAAVHADYEELQRRHAALQESEERYRRLAASLEQRVREQVQTIEAAQRQLYQAEKLASVGQLAAGVAHEINNPIGFVRSNLSTARSYLETIAAFLAGVKRPDAAAALEARWRELDLDFVLKDCAALFRESIDGIERVARIVSDLKAFSNVDRSEEQRADANELIRTVCNVAAGRIGAGRVTLDLQPLPALRCRPGHLSQAVLNLLLNAVEAVKDGGDVTLRTRAAGGGVEIVVEDTGCGMPPEVLSRVFDPFFTTREVGQGTGLGLTVARDVVYAHGGGIDVSSAPGRGTVFTIRLPTRE